MATEFKITSGNTKGTPLEKATDQDILFCGKRHLDDLVKEPGGQYAGFKVKWLAAARTVLNARGNGDLSELTPSKEILAAVASGGNGGGAQGAQGGAYRAKPAAAAPAPAQAPRQAASAPSGASTALARGPMEGLVQSRNISQINDLLAKYEEECHLVTPATSCGSLPVGFEIAFSMIRVSPDTSKTGPGDVAPVGGGKLSLAKTPMKRIGAAAAISWDMRHSGRVDDRSEPLYCAWRAVGVVKNFDGSPRVVSGELDIDMRDGSKDIEAMYGRGKEAANVDAQIRDMRLFLQRHCETKAKLRAIEDIGLKRSYTEAELAKPFVVARLMWTGRDDDPEIQRMLTMMSAESHFASMRAMFGASAVPALPAPQRTMSFAQPVQAQYQVSAAPQFAPTPTVVEHPQIPPARPTPQPQQGDDSGPPDDDEHDPGFAEDLAT